MDHISTHNDTGRPGIVLVNRALVVDPAQHKILLIKRAAGDSHNPSLWEAPGGKLDEGQDLTNALEREVLEETGLLVETQNRLVYAQSEIATSSKYQGMLYVQLFGIATVVGGKLKLSDEHADSAWVTFEEALDYDLTLETRKALIVLEKTLRKIMQAVA